MNAEQRGIWIHLVGSDELLKMFGRKFQLNKLKSWIRSSNMLYNIVSAVNSALLYTEKFVKRTDLMLIFLP